MPRVSKAVFDIMKKTDPSSVVREGEFKYAMKKSLSNSKSANARSVGYRGKKSKNKASKGY